MNCTKIINEWTYHLCYLHSRAKRHVVSRYQSNSCHLSSSYSVPEVIQLNDERYNKFSTKIFHRNAIDNEPEYCVDTKLALLAMFLHSTRNAML